MWEYSHLVYIPRKPYSHVIFTDHANIQWVVAQCMPALDDSRKQEGQAMQQRASTLCVECVCFHSVSRMRHSRRLAILLARYAVHGCETALASLHGRQAIGSRGVRGYRKYSSLMSAQEMRTPFEVGCCDSRFDENPTSSGSADEQSFKTIITSHIHRPRLHTVGCWPVYACTRQFTQERRPTATSLNPLCRMRMFPLGPPNEALPPYHFAMARWCTGATPH